jgi:predicted RNA binding protein YcfA (HicA-like mRNA interferase family)
VPKGFYVEVTRELRLLGYERIHGAKHEKWAHPNGHVMIVPRKILSRHTANGILKDCGSSKCF